MSFETSENFDSKITVNSFWQVWFDIVLGLSNSLFVCRPRKATDVWGLRSSEALDGNNLSSAS